MSSLHSILCLTKIRTMKFIPTVLSYEPNWWVGECRPVNTSTPEYWLCYHLIRTLLSGANTASVFACRTRVIRAQRPPVLGSCTPAVRDKTSTYFRELHASCSPRTYAHVQGSCMRAVCEIQCVRALTRPSSFHRSDSVTLKQWPVPLNPWHDFTQSLQTCRNS